jgi:hypothetical protein
VAASHLDRVDYVHPSYLQASFDAGAGTPRVFTIEGAALKIRPLDGTALELDYFQKLPALSDVQTSNWLLAAHPDLYLFGALVEAEAFNKDADSAALWKLRRDESFDEIEKLGGKSRAGAIRVMGTIA